MITSASQDLRPVSIFHEPREGSSACGIDLFLPQLKNHEEFLMGINEILDEISPSPDHGPLSGIYRNING